MSIQSLRLIDPDSELRSTNKRKETDDMTCRLISTGVTLTGTATVSYAWGFKWGFPSLFGSNGAVLLALRGVPDF